MSSQNPNQPSPTNANTKQTALRLLARATAILGNEASNILVCTLADSALQAGLTREQFQEMATQAYDYCKNLRAGKLPDIVVASKLPKLFKP